MENPRVIVAKHLLDVADLWKQNDLHLDSNGYCTLRTDDELDVLLEVKEKADDLLVVADLGVDLKEHQAMELLHENMFSFRWKHASFSREANRGRVFFLYHYPIDALSRDKLSNLLINFIDTARKARKLVTAIANGKKRSTAAPRTKSSNASEKFLSSSSSLINKERNTHS